MLQCPRCSNPLTVTHCSHDSHCCQQQQQQHDQQQQQRPPSIIQYPVYQNCVSPPAPTPAPTPQQQLQEAQDQERNMLIQLQGLQIKVLQNQLQQVRLQVDNQLQSRGHVSRAGPETVLSPSDTEQILLNSKHQLEQCGWYYGSLSWQQSVQMLSASEPGTFLVRDSQDPRFLYSLSLQQPGSAGPTSVRIAFHKGHFSLDADERIWGLMPKFDSIGSLISYYVSQEQSEECGERGCPRSQVGKLCLRSPLYKSPPSLAHFARLEINRSLTTGASSSSTHAFSTTSSLSTLRSQMLPSKLLDYLAQYPLRI